MTAFKITGYIIAAVDTIDKILKYESKLENILGDASKITIYK